ncbi:MAG: class I SAM-dependent methyltransferase [Phascolarctobacterium sp.]|nr:class I SAM-dependent methyltransferase [Phascolarctobacterium sp.]
MNIGSRLTAVGRLIEDCAVLADIGTDHAYLPTYLIEQKKIHKALACDIAEGPCEAARQTIAIHGLKQQIEVRLGGGLTVLAPYEADSIAICGMGASTIVQILEESPAVFESAKQLVLQPMAGAASLRKWLGEHGWEINAECLVDDEPHFYEIISARKGNVKNYNTAELYLGPQILANKPELFHKHVLRQCQTLERLLTNMGKSEKAKASDKYQETLELLQLLEGYK